MATEKELDEFLASFERRAFKRAAYAVRDDEAALDLVQEAMISLAQNYGDRPVEELPLLFQRILGNAINDHFRREKSRSAWMVNQADLAAGPGHEGGEFDLLEILEVDDASGLGESADSTLAREQILRAIDEELQNLSERQREAFLLRYLEELDVAETAQIMGCSEGSIKTHCSRATQALAKALKARGISL